MARVDLDRAKADLLLLGGRVITFDPARPVASAVAVAGGRIAAVGCEKDMHGLIGPSTRAVNASGMTVTPGFSDAHMHLLGLGLMLSQVELSCARSISDMREMVRRFIEERGISPGTWVVGRGWDQNLLAEGRFPTADDLEGAAPRNPVLLLRVCGHAAVLNEMAAKAIGLSASSDDPPSGRLGRREDGSPNGLLFEHGAIDLALRAIPPAGPRELERALELAAARAVAVGLTEVHSDDIGYAEGFGQVYSAYLRLSEEGRLPIRITMQLLAKDFDEVRRLIEEHRDTVGHPVGGSGTGQVSDRLRIGPIKILLDGSLGARTAALEEPYSDAPGESGILNIEPEELFAMVELAHRAGRQVAIHAIGDRAARVALDAIEAAQARHPRADARHQLIHCQIMNPGLWARMAELGVTGNIQPRFVATDWPIVEARVGAPRAAVSYAWKSMLAAGVRLVGSSDSPVEPPDPLLGVHAALSRTDPEGRPGGGWQAGERLDVQTALRLFAGGGAFAAFSEAERGVIAPGKAADFSVFDGDYLAEPEAVARENAVRMTVMGGKVRFSVD